MAKGKKESATVSDGKIAEGIEDFTVDLIRSINKEMGLRVAYNLNEMDAPTIVKRWLSTGSVQLDYLIRNAVGGGYPEGRIIELTGPPSSGKSHLAYHTAAIVQQMGGLVVYIDSENATMIQKLAEVGIDVRKRFVYVDEHCTQNVFHIIETIVLKAKQLPATKDIPIFVVWDSVAATSPKEELEGDYDQSTMGLQARIISKGMRKITGVIGHNNVTFLCINQLRDAIGVMHGDPLISPGGKAIPFHASLRIRLSSGTQVKDKEGNIIGIHAIVTIKKNKVAPPHRKCELDIIFGKGISEHEYVFDECRSYCENHEVEASGKKIKLSGVGGWKQLQVIDSQTGEVLIEKSFHKPDFGDMMKDPQYKPFIDKVIDCAYTMVTGEKSDGESPDTDVDVKDGES